MNRQNRHNSLKLSNQLGEGWQRNTTENHFRDKVLRQPTESNWGEELEALSDNELVKQTINGSMDAFGIIVKRYQKPLHSLSMRYVHDSCIAEDIVQESLMKAFEKISSFQFRSAFKSWLYRIVINTAKNSLRSMKPTVEIDKVSIQVENQCEGHLVDKQLLLRAQALIKHLPDKQKKAVQMRVFKDMSFKEVAHKMDCPYDTAKANYRHGLIKLREKMISLC